MRAHLRLNACLAAFCLAASAGAWAQAAPAAAPVAPPDEPASSAGLDRTPVERVERIHIEDSGSRVDELRVGGQTKSITVQSKTGVPPYQVQPADVTHPARPTSGPGSAGERTWKIVNF